MRLRRVEPVLRRALRGRSAPARPARGAPATLLVAVSGGADSTALLIGLANLSRDLGFRLHAAHLHHGLRGAEADADLEFVRALCGRLGVPLTAARWDTRARLRRRGLSGQAGLRTLRREFLLAAARRAGARAIVTAHTADDQLETLLMRLARGAGLSGLPGMRPALATRDGSGRTRCSGSSRSSGPRGPRSRPTSSGPARTGARTARTATRATRAAACATRRSPRSPGRCCPASTRPAGGRCWRGGPHKPRPGRSLPPGRSRTLPGACSPGRAASNPGWSPSTPAVWRPFPPA